MSTEIQWTWKFDKAGNVISKGRTWNFLSGCDKVSPACKNCYASSLHTMRHEAKKKGAAGLPPQYDKPFSEIQFHTHRLYDPQHWTKPCRIFVNSMSDTFHDKVDREVLVQAFATMSTAEWHTFLVLTKRSKRAREVLSDDAFRLSVAAEVRRRMRPDKAEAIEAGHAWPLDNVAIGASAENQEWADKRIPDLLATPARWRFLSCEPLLGAIDLSRIEYIPVGNGMPEQWRDPLNARSRYGVTWMSSVGIDWVISGGESGSKARPTNPNHFRKLRDECVKAGVAFFHKQNGEYRPGRISEDGLTSLELGIEFFYFEDRPDRTRGVPMFRAGKKKAGRLLDGVEWNQFPEGM